MMQHFLAEHWTHHNAMLRGRKHRDRKCKACSESCGPFRTQKQLKAHVVDKAAHSIVELLDAGYEVWLTHIDSRASAEVINSWLLTKGFITLVPVKAKKTKDEEEEWLEKPRKRTIKK